MRKGCTMPAKTILSVVGVDHGGDDLFAAAELARQSGAHLNALVISCVPPPPLGDLAGQTYSTYAFAWKEENDRVNARADELKAQLVERGLEGNVQPLYCLTQDVDNDVAVRAIYADVVLVGGGMLRDSHLAKRVLDGALFASPAPVVLASEGTAVSLTPKTVLVAWNSSVEAGAAVRHAMDMLTQAANVHVVLVDPVAMASEMGEEPGADMATYLARHGVTVTIEVLASGGLDPALVLQRHATDIGAELIVMGAYGHSRLRERIFGGTTHTMVNHVKLPVLMAH
jgi:nucleotide-binding universal stress UspA family protein